MAVYLANVINFYFKQNKKGLYFVV